MKIVRKKYFEVFKNSLEMCKKGIFWQKTPGQMLVRKVVTICNTVVYMCSLRTRFVRFSGQIVSLKMGCNRLIVNTLQMLRTSFVLANRLITCCISMNCTISGRFFADISL